MSTSGDDKPEFSDSDRRWFTALSGKAPEIEDSQGAREGHALRTALEARVREIDESAELEAATDDAAMDLKLQRLLERADAEGVFDRPPAEATGPGTSPSNVVPFPWWRRRRALVALAASVLVGAVAINQWVGRPDYSAPPTMLGAGGVQEVQASLPQPTAEALAAQLREKGLRPGIYQRGKTYIVDITLLASELPAAEAPFATLGVHPVAGFNRIEVAPR